MNLSFRVTTHAGMYYGGEPVEWTSVPGIPHEARYEVMNKPLPPPAHPPPRSAVAAAVRPAAAAAAAAAARPAAARPAGGAAVAAGAVRAGAKVAPQHPLAGVGGYQMPDVGRIGGAKGVGSAAAGSAAQQAGSTAGDKVSHSYMRLAGVWGLQTKLGPPVVWGLRPYSGPKCLCP